jgi:hypothetical protein
MARPESKAESEQEARVARLLGLLLIDALRTIAGGRRAVGARETREWVCAAPGTRPYSFDEACAAYSLPPRALRRRLGLRAQAAPRPDRRGWTRRPSH